MKTLKSIVLTLALAAFTLTARSQNFFEGMGFVPSSCATNLVSLCVYYPDGYQQCYDGNGAVYAPSGSTVVATWAANDCNTKRQCAVEFEFFCGGIVTYSFQYRDPGIHAQSWVIWYNVLSCQWSVTPSQNLPCNNGQ
jgi:hypothetical protein